MVLVSKLNGDITILVPPSIEAHFGVIDYIYILEARIKKINNLVNLKK